MTSVKKGKKQEGGEAREVGGNRRKVFGRRQSSMKTDEIGHARGKRLVGWSGVLVGAGGRGGLRVTLR